MGLRRQSREAALKFLYQSDSHVESLTDDPQKFAQHFGISEAIRGFFFELVEGVQNLQSTIDPLLEDVAEHWKLYRMGRIDRCILRISCYELMKCPATDYQVIIDEAVELAKIYGSSDSAAFVNGILDRLAKRIRKIEAPAAQATPVVA